MVRTLNFGSDATDADYQIRDTSSTGGDLIIEHLPTGATFEYDSSENAWIPTDPIGTSNRKASAITTTSVSTETLNTTTKYLSSFDTLQAAGDAVPEGATLVIDGDFDVATIGTGTWNKMFTIQGQGWARDDSGNLAGSVIRNSGGDVVDSTVFEFAGSSATFPRDSGAFLDNFAIVHEGSTTPAVKFADTPRSLTSRMWIDLNKKAPYGVQYTGQSFFGRGIFNHISKFTDVGVFIQGDGFGDEWLSNHINTNADTNPSITGLSGPAALRTEREYTRVVGGQYSVNVSTNEGVSVQFFNPGSDNLVGGEVSVATESSDVGVDIDGDTDQFTHVNIGGRFNLNQLSNAVREGKAFDCKLINPAAFNTGGGGELETLGSGTGRHISLMDYTAAKAPATDNGFNNQRVIYGTLQDSLLANIDTTMDSFVFNASDHESVPAVIDGGQWKHLASATTNFTPS